ncbi:hypothetical protein [Convivina intestini]|uniref:hypothetical protein n=1 Tax=Convivina intestini TaxID=1505726 RepID=UPI00200E15C5|nr:hypothetical protein [Convivina intestini]CAH1857288.1 hypothetical protein R078131_01573 [Convivina intestini]
MKIFKWRKDESQPNQEDQVEWLQIENDKLLNQVESLKLDLTELRAENQDLVNKLSGNKYHRTFIKTGSGLGVLMVTYILLAFMGAKPTDITWLLLIEAIFIFLMLRGDDK